MSQFQNPYPGPQPGPYPPQPAYGPYPAYPGPPHDPLARAKRAGMLMIVLGILGLTCGGIGLLAALNWDKLMAMQSPEMRSQLASATAGQALAQQVITLAIAAVFIGLGLAVRRGQRGPTIGAVVVTGLLLGLCALIVLAGGVLAASGSLVGGANLCVGLVAGGILLWQLLWLMSATRARASQQMYAAYQAQYWQYLAQQQAYQMGGAAPGGSNAAVPSQNPYHAPAAGSAQGAAEQTGWQWTAPPPPPPPPPPPYPSASPPVDSKESEGGPDGQGPQ